MAQQPLPGEQAQVDDYRWLVSDAAARWLNVAAAADGASVQMASRLRKELSPARVHLVLELAALRRQAARSGRFPDAGRMFFTAKLVQQATSHAVAAYKAGRFPAKTAIADLCCGIGGDLLALAARGATVGVDSNHVALVLAAANCRVAGRHDVRLVQCEAAHFPLDGYDYWHADPDRRPAGRRTTRPELHRPSLAELERLRDQSPAAAIKLAPAADVPAHWADEAELEWVGEHRECKQLVVWCGELARHPGRRAATILRHGASPITVVGRAGELPPRAEQVGRYVYEPHAVVLAAGLAGHVAATHQLTTISADGGYLGGERLIADDALTAFEVTDVMPFDTKRLKDALRQARVGRLEVKKRRVEVDPAAVRRQLKVPGVESRVLLLTRFHRRSTAILARRVER